MSNPTEKDVVSRLKSVAECLAQTGIDPARLPEVEKAVVALEDLVSAENQRRPFPIISTVQKPITRGTSGSR